MCYFLQTLAPMKRTVENIRDPLFRFFEREVNVGIQMLADVRRDIEDAILICLGEKKQTNHHRILLAALAKSQLFFCLLYVVRAVAPVVCSTSQLYRSVFCEKKICGSVLDNDQVF